MNGPSLLVRWTKIDAPPFFQLPVVKTSTFFTSPFLFFPPIFFLVPCTSLKLKGGVLKEDGTWGGPFAICRQIFTCLDFGMLENACKLGLHVESVPRCFVVAVGAQA
eukprot:TRINITY_DN7976_c2_g1_i2.p2 TRINITY_DN7976_c2_g1~~TRINITY_DN7976_c2_g1_i2.p2  ORF type:complete len:107 (-),score=13.90 TRINITY_DN7976_c2_g1_i2:1525-1845(-)